MSELKFLVIHCTATPEGREVTKEEILEWHTGKKPNGRGWKKPGYTDLIMRSGALVNITPFDQDDEVEAWEMTNGVRGKNGISRHIVYAGGMTADMKNPKDTRTAKQFAAMETYIKYTVLRHPDILVAGHNQFAPKACPSFNVPDYLRRIYIPNKNIYIPRP